jgi:hypothetical protein
MRAHGRPANGSATRKWSSAIWAATAGKAAKARPSRWCRRSLYAPDRASLPKYLPSSSRGAAGRGRPPQAAARRAGLEFVEKLLTANLTGTDTTERNTGMLRVRSSHRWSSWLLVLAPRRPGPRCRCPAEAPLSSSPISRAANLELVAHPNSQTASWGPGLTVLSRAVRSPPSRAAVGADRERRASGRRERSRS